MGGWAWAVGVAQGWRGGGGGHGAREGGWGSAAGAVRLGVRRANAWRACGVERGGSHRQISSGWKALSHDRLCPLTPPISPWASRSLEYIHQFSTAHKSTPNNVFPKFEYANVSETCLMKGHVPQFQLLGMRRVPQQREAPQNAQIELEYC